MTILDCAECGGNHYGSLKCPMEPDYKMAFVVNGKPEHLMCTFNAKTPAITDTSEESPSTFVPSVRSRWVFWSNSDLELSIASAHKLIAGNMQLISDMQIELDLRKKQLEKANTENNSLSKVTQVVVSVQSKEIIVYVSGNQTCNKLLQDIIKMRQLNDSQAWQLKGYSGFILDLEDTVYNAILKHGAPFYLSLSPGVGA